MLRAITAGAIAFVVAIALHAVGANGWLVEHPQAAAGVADMAGAWTGSARIVVSWTAQRDLPVALTIDASGRVVGTVGDAVLRNGRLEPNRTAIGRALHVKTDWIVRGDLDGDVIKAEGIRRASVSVPLNWIDDHFEGGVNTSGSHFGGKDTMWLAAASLRLDRIKVRQ